MYALKMTVERARDLRGRMTRPEILLWGALRGRRLGGARFRRQHPVGPFILDFYCEAARLAVEIDGAAHDHPDQARHDARRTWPCAGSRSAGSRRGTCWTIWTAC